MTVEKAREWQLPQTPADLATALEHTGYLPDEGIATAAFGSGTGAAAGPSRSRRPSPPCRRSRP